LSGRVELGELQTIVISKIFFTLPHKNQFLPLAVTLIPWRMHTIVERRPASSSLPAHTHMTVPIATAQHLKQAWEGSGDLRHCWIKREAYGSRCTESSPETPALWREPEVKVQSFSEDDACLVALLVVTP